MTLRIEDYAMIRDTESAALIGKNGSVDWLCAPRFDSPAFFAALLGTEANGHWQIAPAGAVRRVERRYRQGTVVLETDFETDDGAVGVDELAGSEGAFLVCSFWLVSALALAGRIEEAERNLERLRALQNDVGLFSEEYDPVGRRLLGNFPQAFSHLGLLHSIFTISEAKAGR